MGFSSSIIESGGPVYAWVQGGNSFGAEGVLGTNDAFDLNIRRDGLEYIRLAATELIINDTGAARNFRVGGDTLPNLFVVVGTTDQVAIGTATPGLNTFFQVSQPAFSSDSRSIIVVFGGAHTGQ